MAGALDVCLTLPEAQQRQANESGEGATEGCRRDRDPLRSVYWIEKFVFNSGVTRYRRLPKRVMHRLLAAGLTQSRHVTLPSSLVYGVGKIKRFPGFPSKIKWDILKNGFQTGGVDCLLKSSRHELYFIVKKNPPARMAKDVFVDTGASTCSSSP